MEQLELFSNHTSTPPSPCPTNHPLRVACLARVGISSSCWRSMFFSRSNGRPAGPSHVLILTAASKWCAYTTRLLLRWTSVGKLEVRRGGLAYTDGPSSWLHLAWHRPFGRAGQAQTAFSFLFFSFLSVYVVRSYVMLHERLCFSFLIP